MKTMLIGCLVLFFSGCAHFHPNAKNHCAGVETKTDAFGKSKRGYISYTDKGWRAVGLFTDNDKLIMRVLFSFSQAVDNVIPAGKTAKIAFDDGTVTDFTVAVQSSPVRGIAGYSIYTQWSVDFVITQDQAALLASSPLKAVKIELGSIELLDRFDDGTGEVLMYLAKCLSNDQQREAEVKSK